jgi:FkbM family methyltransferase
MLKITLKNIVRKCFEKAGYSLSKYTEDSFSLQKKFCISRSPIIFDVGAHVGEVASIYRKLFPTAAIHCFEPFPDSFEVLSKNKKNDSLTFCHQVAVSNINGTAQFNSNIGNATNSLLATDQSNANAYWGSGLLETKKQIVVETIKIDDFCQKNSIAHLDILKMDVQGAEYSALYGANFMLSNQKIALIYLELIICPTYEGQKKLHEYLALFETHRYVLLDFFNPVRKGNKLLQVDAIFINEQASKEI